ncbi:MAG: hypothetical protein K2W95_00825 [Candidatus Obscuribacterales bacterium]|nr:hypothetical protein [Candidatus Obscuribacterales bacterium]
MSQLLRDQFIKEMGEDLDESTGLGLLMGDAWKPVFHQKKTDSRRVEKTSFVWPAVVGETEEGGALNRLTVKHGFSSFVVPKTYTGEIKISHEFMRDNKFPEVKEKAFGLGLAFSRNRYKLACDILVNGFSSVTSPDSVSLFNAAHVLSANNSATDSNIAASHAPLTTDAFDTCMADMMTTLDENGEVYPTPINKIRIICVPQNLRQALQIAGSTYEPETMNNAINVYSGAYGKYSIEVVCLPLLFGQAPSTWRATQWYVQLPELHGLEFYEREAIETWQVSDQNSLSVLYQGLDAFGFLIRDWRFMFGSKGNA